jgi:hypothetical protein
MTIDQATIIAKQLGDFKLNMGTFKGWGKKELDTLMNSIIASTSGKSTSLYLTNL